jgi:multiple sugar transport system substrate-binding protein
LTFHYYAGTGGTNDLTPDGQATTIDPEKLAQTYTFLQEAEQFGTDVNTFDQIATDLFMTDKMAFINQGPWFYVQMEEAKKQNVNLDYDYVLIPGQTAERKGGIMGGEFIAIMPGPTADAAWKWAAYLTDGPQMTRLAAVLGRFVGNEVALQDPEVQKNSMVQLTAEATQQAVIELPLFVKLPENYLNPVSDYGLLVAQGKLTPEEAAAQAIQAINTSLQEME